MLEGCGLHRFLWLIIFQADMNGQVEEERDTAAISLVPSRGHSKPRLLEERTSPGIPFVYCSGRGVLHLPAARGSALAVKWWMHFPGIPRQSVAALRTLIARLSAVSWCPGV